MSTTTTEVKERQAGRITEIQNLKISLRNLTTVIEDFRDDPHNLANANLSLGYVIEKLESAISGLDVIQRRDL